VAAAKVGGIKANDTFPVEFLTENLQIQSNLMDAAHAAGIGRLLFLGSSCIYPKFAEQPIREDSLLTGPLEPTNEAYAIAKIAGIRLADGYRREYGREWISAMPTNIYGSDDNFDLETSHVLPALIHRLHDAKTSGAPAVTLWGTGTALREFLHADDLAEASLFLLDNYNEPGPINVGFGEEISIRDLATTIAGVVGYEGEIRWDSTKPDGTPRKILDSGRIRALGWTPRIGLLEGITRTYRSYLAAS
jgi:GDP-L-fucose synthase